MSTFGSTARYEGDDPNGEDGGGGLLLGLGITEIIVFLFIVICIYLALRYSKALRTSLIGAIGGYKDREKGILNEDSRMYRFAKAIGIIPPAPKTASQTPAAPVQDQKAYADATKVLEAHKQANQRARRLEEATKVEPNCSYALDNSGMANIAAQPAQGTGMGSTNCEAIKQFLKDKFALPVARSAFQMFADNHNGGKEG